MLPQPNDDTCGPTCLQAVYRYWGDHISIDQVVDSVTSLNLSGESRGTLAVTLGVDALSRGYRATIYTFNLQVFDPTWFAPDSTARSDQLAEKLRAQAIAKSAKELRFGVATRAYLEFLRRGGSVRFQDPTSRLISGFIRDGRPILTGLSATYLYRCAREYGPNDDYDDVRGEPVGHFVVVHGYDPQRRHVTIADPMADNPGFDSQRYSVSISRLVVSIMLGILTYDANMLVIEPSNGPRPHEAPR